MRIGSNSEPPGICVTLILKSVLLGRICGLVSTKKHHIPESGKWVERGSRGAVGAPSVEGGSAGSTPSIIMDVGEGTDRNPLLKMAWRLHGRSCGFGTSATNEDDSYKV